MTQNLIMVPTKLEQDGLLAALGEAGLAQEEITIGTHNATSFPEVGLVVALGGLGKVQFAVQTQYLIDRVEGLAVVLCVGAAGALAPGLRHGDVVVATETVEHDIRKFSRPLVPRFESDGTLRDEFASLARELRAFDIHFGPIASGDEDIMSDIRKQELREQTGAVAVAWEGAGGARACQFSNIPYLELRGITDSAGDTAESEFFTNLERVMANLAELLVGFVQAR